MDFMEYFPFEEMNEDRWAAYAACVIWACARDGLSTQEKDAIKDWLNDKNAPENVLEKANTMAAAGITDLVSGLASNSAVGVYLVRDATRLAMVDGLSAPEAAGIQELADLVGVAAHRTESIRSAIETYVSSQRHWQAALS